MTAVPDPVAAASVQVAGANYTLDTRPEDMHATFRIKLPEGKTQLATTLMDADDLALCSAIYVYLKRIPDGEADSATLTPTSNRKAKGTAKPRQKPRKKSASVR